MRRMHTDAPAVNPPYRHRLCAASPLRHTLPRRVRTPASTPQPALQLTRNSALNPTPWLAHRLILMGIPNLYGYFSFLLDTISRSLLNLLGGSQALCAWNGTLRRGPLSRALKEAVIRPCTEPGQNWDADGARRSAEPSIPCEWVGAGRNRAHDSGPLRIPESGAVSPAGLLMDMAGALSSPHGCLVGGLRRLVRPGSQSDGGSLGEGGRPAHRI
jgi:hypothetical protein